MNSGEMESVRQFKNAVASLAEKGEDMSDGAEAPNRVWGRSLSGRRLKYEDRICSGGEGAFQYFFER